MLKDGFFFLKKFLLAYSGYAKVLKRDLELCSQRVDNFSNYLAPRLNKVANRSNKDFKLPITRKNNIFVKSMKKYKSTSSCKVLIFLNNKHQNLACEIKQICK